MSIVIKPLVTEKSLALANRGWYTFAVLKTAVKGHIASAIAKQYKVKVEDVRTVTMPGKTRRVGKSMRTVEKSDWKKALVRLTKGQTIDTFQQVVEQMKGK